MEYVGDFCNPCKLVPYMSSQKGELYVATAQHATLVTFAGKFDACVLCYR